MVHIVIKREPVAGTFRPQADEGSEAHEPLYSIR